MLLFLTLMDCAKMFLVKSTKLYLIIVAEFLISTILSIFSILIAENDIQRQSCWEMWAENLNEYRCGHFAKSGPRTVFFC